MNTLRLAVLSLSLPLAACAVARKASPAVSHPSAAPLPAVDYELGLSEARVSTLARNAMDKLRVRSRAELIELHGAIVNPSEPADGGEQEV